MTSCYEAMSWKAVHVLAGSIVEALLVEYLVVSSINPGGRDPLQIQLGEAIKACHAAGVIKESTASLCDVVRDYRNLIHPGRVIRLEQDVTAEGAGIATHLVALITKEVAAKRKATYGPTAEQIIKKLRTDQHALALLTQLLNEANLLEKRRLVFSLAPDAYGAEASDMFAMNEDVLARLRLGYRQALELLTREDKMRAAAKFSKLVREDSAEAVQSYGDAFFMADDIDYLNPADAQIARDYLLSRLEQPGVIVSEGLIRTTGHLGKFVKLEDVVRFTSVVVRFVLRQPSKSSKDALDFAETLFDSANDEVRRSLQERIEYWVALGKKSNYPESAQARLEILESKWVYLPF